MIPPEKIEIYRKHYRRMANEQITGEGWAMLEQGGHWRVRPKEPLPWLLEPNERLPPAETMRVVVFRIEGLPFGDGSLSALKANGLIIGVERPPRGSGPWVAATKAMTDAGDTAWDHPTIDAVEKEWNKSGAKR